VALRPRLAAGLPLSQVRVSIRYPDLNIAPMRPVPLTSGCFARPPVFILFVFNKYEGASQRQKLSAQLRAHLHRVARA
jgi:hypothetical protein